jgi:hypothetical protein
MKTITVSKERYAAYVSDHRIRGRIADERALDLDPGTHRASVLFGVRPSQVSESQRQAARRTLATRHQQ